MKLKKFLGYFTKTDEQMDCLHRADKYKVIVPVVFRLVNCFMDIKALRKKNTYCFYKTAIPYT